MRHPTEVIIVRGLAVGVQPTDVRAVLFPVVAQPLQRCRLRSEGDPTLGVLSVLIPLMGLRRRHHHQPDRPPARAINLKIDKGRQGKEEVTDHLITHHPTTKIGSERIQEETETRIPDRQAEVVRKRN